VGDCLYLNALECEHFLLCMFFIFILEPMHSPVPRAQARISIFFFNGVYCCFIFIITVAVEVCILIDTSDSLVYVVS